MGASITLKSIAQLTDRLGRDDLLTSFDITVTFSYVFVWYKFVAYFIQNYSKFPIYFVNSDMITGYEIYGKCI